MPANLSKNYGQSGHMQRQSGFALIVGLVVLLLLTLIMLMALRMASLEERMAGNLRNQNIAFQAAESALREAEARIRNGTDGVDADDDGIPDANVFNPLMLSGGPFQKSSAPFCVDGLCGESTPLQSTLIRELWKEDPTALRAAGLGIPKIIREPRYVIELISLAPHSDARLMYATFRVTAMAWGEDPNSLVQLQSTYRSEVRFVH